MFLPSSVTIMFFLRPESCRWPSESKRPRSPVISQPSTIVSAVSSGSLRYPAIAVGYGDAEVVEKLQGLRLGEGTANDDGAELAAKALVDLPQKTTAETQA